MTLDLPDTVVLIAYFAAVIAVGLWFGRGEKDTHDFFLGGRRQHWIVVGLSIVATEVSALTFIAVPADAFRGDWSYLQMYAGAFVGRLLIVYLLLPRFYGGSVTTVYEYLGQRFGAWTRTTAAIMFFASRILGSGVRLLVASIAIAVVFGWPVEWVILAAAGLAIAYTTFGGIKAIIWTDALQALIFVGGGCVAVGAILSATPGDWTVNLASATEAGKFHVFNWGTNPNNDKLFWVLFIHATVLNMAALGTDQDLTQRMLTCPDLRRGQRSLLFNAVIGFPVVCLFLLVGALLWVHYASSGGPLPEAIVAKSDRVFAYFIATGVPGGFGLRGLLVAGVFAAAMSSLDSALGALSSTAVTDFYRPLRHRRSRLRRVGSESLSRSAATQFLSTGESHPGNNRTELRLARAFTLAFGILLAGVAMALRHYDELLWQAFQWVSLVFGGMLGVFLLGATTSTRGSDRLNVIAMLTSVAILVTLRAVQEATQAVYIAWPWWVVIGTGWTYVVGLCGSTDMNTSRTRPRRGVPPGADSDESGGT